VVWTDVDMTYPNDRIPELVDALDGYDQVVGCPHREKGTKKAARVPAKWVIRRLAQYLSQEEIPDLNSGFRAFKRDAAIPYLHRLPNGFSCVTTITMSFLADGLAVGYVPIPYEAARGRVEVPLVPGHEAVPAAGHPHDPVVPAPAGLPADRRALLAFGLGKLGYDLVTKDLRLATNTLLILFAAFQVISIGLLADLVVRATTARSAIRCPEDPRDTSNVCPSDNPNDYDSSLRPALGQHRVHGGRGHHRGCRSRRDELRAASRGDAWADGVVHRAVHRGRHRRGDARG
jgi:hypothetical protein